MTTVEERPVEAPAQHVMHVLDETGDTMVAWRPDSDVEVSAARAHFNRMRDAGHLAYRTDEGGGQAEQIREFDPQAARILFAPQLQGG